MGAEYRRATIKMTVIGVGGCGVNTITNLENRLEEVGISVPTIAVDTDAAVISKARAMHKIVIGELNTKGRGTGGDMNLGREIMEREINKVASLIGDAELILVTAGLGGGTGSGGVVALADHIKSNMPNSLLWTILTLPFSSEGGERARNAATALREVLRIADMAIVNSNDLLRTRTRYTTVLQAFKRMDNVLVNTIMGLLNLQSLEPFPGLVNVNFANVERITRNSGLGFAGIGEGTNPLFAFESAMAENYIEADISGARGAVVLIEANRTALRMGEVEEIPRVLGERYGIDNVYFGVRPDWRLHAPRVTLIVSSVRSRFVDDYLRRAG